MGFKDLIRKLTGGKKDYSVDNLEIADNIKRLRKEMQQYEPGSSKHMEIETKISELKALKSN